MDVSTHIVGIRDLDGMFAKMITIKEACEAASTDYPVGLTQYFNNEEGESVEYLRTKMQEISLDHIVDKNEVQEDMTDTFDVQLSLIPEDVKVIRFKNCYG